MIMNKRKVAILLLVSLVLCMVIALPAFAETAEFDYTPFTDEVVDLVGDLTTPAVTILGIALALAGGVMLVKVGYRWIRGFIR